MTFRLSNRAIRQLRQINDFIAKDNEDAASEVLRRLSTTFRHLAEYPKLGHEGRREGTREFVQVPFIVVYRITRNGIVIAAVFHGNQEYQ